MQILDTINSARARWSLALAAGAFVIGLAPLADGDLWWHLAAGRELARTHAFLMIDPFSAQTAGRPWVDVHWLFQLAAYHVFAVGGLRALVVMKAALVAAGALVLQATVVSAAGPRARAVFVPAFLGALFVARGLLLLRPIIPTLLFLALFVFLLEKFRRDGRLVWLAPLPLLQVAWSNVQALSMLGPALVGTHALAAIAWRHLGRRSSYPFAAEQAPGVDGARAARALLGALALCVAACFATPYGVRAVVLPFSLLARFWPSPTNVYSTNVAENVPPWALDRAASASFGHVGLLLATIALALAAAPRLALSRLAIVGALATLALVGNRNVLLCAWLATPLAAVAVTPRLRRARIALRRQRWALAAPRWLARGAILAALTVSGVAAARETPLGLPAPWRAPVESARIIAEHGDTGSIFAADQYGGYLMWSLGPAYKPFMDTRLVLRTRAEFEEYLAVVDDPTLFDAWERDKGFAYVLLPVAYPDRYLPLVAHLYGSQAWQLAYTDGSEALFARRSNAAIARGGDRWDLGAPAVVDRIVADLSHRFGADARLQEAARAQLATLLLAIDAPAMAERSLDGLATPLADALRARARLATGDLDGAARLAEVSLARDGADVPSLDVLALVAARQNDSSRARQLLRRALEVDPYDVEAEKLLARWEGQ
jgi:hypothetical protein